MASNAEDILTQLPSPPLSPSKLCKEVDEVNLYNNKFDFYNDEASENERFFEEFLNSEKFIYSDDELMKIEALIGCPIKNQYQPSREDILRNKYMDILKNGIEINGEMKSYSEAVETLHRVGSTIFNKRTDDAVILHVFESGNNHFQEFRIHPKYLSLQSFTFFRLFEEIKENNIGGIIEIEVSSLKIFSSVLYYLYTGIKTEIFERSKSNEFNYNNFMEMLTYLEINMELF
ncbi:hypothetical protein LY90DRAFT_518092 [Neocallimastix californiae]|uniref:BTB domain-containing protein n=1 Tax=Neocallimastix californiae TaxID=1754190 RepID=A0A1Y1ZV62_9FUNG|nr:hypothetical protein LY90DRAFT_518092 [Neocallimastix californiae]|eukprot:ORY14112.1 hypothetical protein LY90DRAFT_518092 [Neocallimastix californiae]